MNARGQRTGLVLVLLIIGGCATNQPEIMFSKKGAVELRAIQSRQFETGDLKKVYRAVIATFLDLGYSITKVEPAAGMASADKLAQLKMTVTVFKRGQKRVIVRSNAIVKLNPSFATGHQVDLAEFYQKRFFEPLSKALFLTALQVEDPPDALEKEAMKAAAKAEKKADGKDAKASGGATNTEAEQTQ